MERHIYEKLENFYKKWEEIDTALKSFERIVNNLKSEIDERTASIELELDKGYLDSKETKELNKELDALCGLAIGFTDMCEETNYFIADARQLSREVDEEIHKE